MTTTVPPPEVLRCYFDDSFSPPLAALSLSWPAGEAGEAGRAWRLPEGVNLPGPPVQFGLRVRRQAADTYAVHLLWDRTRLTWEALTRAQLLDSDLAELLAALSADLWHLLEQPVQGAKRKVNRAA
jgi:hypothetical protein